MQHLKLYEIDGEMVKYNLDDQEEEEMRKLWERERFGYKEFRKFLANKGWEYDQDYVLQPLEKYKGKICILQHILQAWLFFALILCILREGRGGDHAASQNGIQAEGHDSGSEDGLDQRGETTPILTLP